MATFATRIEARLGAQLEPEQIFEVQRQRESKLSRLLMLYIGTGLAFMLLPGTFLGVWNLIAISNRHAADSMSPAWVQAHGHAQIFGWIGTFILGIGFYSIPKLRRIEPFALSICSLCWGLWTAGVTLRWIANVYGWHWRELLPISALLELAAFGMFFHAVSGHKPTQASTAGTRTQDKTGPEWGTRAKFEPWVLVVIAGTIGLMASLLANAAACAYLAFRGAGPAFTHGFDQRFLVLAAWGFMVPFVWGFSAKWMPVMLGLKPTRTHLLLAATAINSLAVADALFGLIHMAVALLFAAAVVAGIALRMFEAAQQPAKTKFVHASFPVFVRCAYGWLLIAAALGTWAARGDYAGVWGASRHALTVGFIATMVFSVGQRVLPAFSGMRLLYSPRLMLAALLLLSFGCILRVSSEVLAYQGFAPWAWRWLPVSAVLELSAVTLFALNLACTFARRPAPQLTQIA